MAIEKLDFSTAIGQLHGSLFVFVLSKDTPPRQQSMGRRILFVHGLHPSVSARELAYEFER